MINQVSFQSSKDIWNLISPSNSIQAPFLTWKWHKDWFSILSDEWKEFILVIDDTVIAPFARKESTVIFSGGDEIADYLDIIGEDGKKQSAWEQIIPFLKLQGVSEIKLRNVPENSATAIYLQNSSAIVQREDTTPLFSLPNSWDSYVHSLEKRYRHELERKIRKFQREHIDAQIISSTDPAFEMPILFSLMEKDESKKAFLTSKMKEFFLAIANTFKGEIQLHYISLGDKKISAITGFIMHNTFFLYNSGFDKECCTIAGFYLKAMSIKSAIEKNVTTYNFLQGNERYKYELGGVDFFVQTITVQL